jgi:hypothetical protein
MSEERPVDPPPEPPQQPEPEPAYEPLPTRDIEEGDIGPDRRAGDD